MKKLLGALTIVAATDCGARAPLPRTTGPSLTIQASADATWRAMMGVFGDDGIPIRVQDRATGHATTNKSLIRERDRGAWSVCGTDAVPADHVVFTVSITGDSTTSTVWATARFTRDDVGSFAECTTKGALEYSIERRIKARAEGGSTE